MSSVLAEQRRSDAPNSESSRRLCAVLGHELRNPLASAVTHVSLAAAMLDAEDPRGENLQRALSDLDRLSHLLSTYLEFGRSGRGDLRHVDAIEIARAVATRSTVCRFSTTVERSPIVADADLLGRALENMLENATEAGASSVSVSLAVKDGAVVIDVVDDGPGVPDDVREQLFEPFVSGRNSTGLGLAVARDAILQSGGSLTLQPKRRGVGAAFRIVLPLADADALLSA